MQVGIVGLGRIGAGMARRLARGGHQVVVWNRTASVATDLAAEAENDGQVTAVASVEDLVQLMGSPRHVLLSLPAGDATQELIDRLVPLLERGTRSSTPGTRTSGTAPAAPGSWPSTGSTSSTWGCPAACGDSRSASAPWSVVSDRLRASRASGRHPRPAGWLSLLRAGGAGHYVKMVHNGIEYGLMEAYGEGFDILHASDYALDLAAIARLWNHGSVIRSWLSSSPPMRSRRRGMTSMASPDGSPIPERDGGPSPTPWSTTSRHRSSPWPSSSASAAVARRTASPTGSSRLRNEFGGHAVKSTDAADAANAPDRPA